MSARPPSGPLTRRAVLEGAALLAGATLLGPPADLARALDTRRSISSRWLGSLGHEPLTVASSAPFSLVGLGWADPARPSITLRARRPDRSWSPWVSASSAGHGPDPQGARSARFGEPVWTGTCNEVQVRSSVPVHDVHVYFVQARRPGPATAASLPLAQPVLAAGPGQPAIIARAAWAQGQAPPAVPPSYGRIRLAFVHHTENPNGYTAAEVPAMLLAIYQFHRYVRGWDDIGYNFVIDLFGRVWEARQGGIDQAVIGAQAGGYNQVSTGVAVLGSFMNVVPSAVALSALERLLAWKLSLHGVPTLGRVTVVVNRSDAFYTPFAPGARVSLPRIAGHRDGDSTNCPGDAFYARLPTVRARAAALAGAPAKLSLKLPSQAPLAGVPFTASGRLRLPSGRAAGRAIEIQQLPEATVGRATAGPVGAWSTQITLTRNVLLRALHRDAPATASDLVACDVAAAIALRLQSLSPPRITGVVYPAKRTATVVIYALRGGRRALVSRTRIAVRRGVFTTKLTLPRAGIYEIQVRTAADRANAAGASGPLVVTV